MLFRGSRVRHEGGTSDLAAPAVEISPAGSTGHIVLDFPDPAAAVIRVDGEFHGGIGRTGGRISFSKDLR